MKCNYVRTYIFGSSHVIVGQARVPGWLQSMYAKSGVHSSPSVRVCCFVAESATTMRHCSKSDCCNTHLNMHGLQFTVEVHTNWFGTVIEPCIIPNALSQMR